MRIAYVTQWFPPEQGTFVAAAIADGLADRGHDVDVLTGFPNYPTGKLAADYPLQMYRRDRRSDRVSVHRAPLYPSHDTNGLRRMANYASFALSAAWVARRHLPEPDAWLIYSSPATAALPSLIAPARLRAPVYMLIQDLWPDSVTESGFVTGPVSRGVERTLHAYCDWSYRRSAGIGVISPGMRTILSERGVDEDKISLAPNWIDDDHLCPELPATDELRTSLGLPIGPLFMYAGNMGELQGLAAVVEAFASCPDANLALVGGGVATESLRVLASDKGLRNVHFIESQPPSRVGRFIAASDVQVVSLRDSALLRATMPSKVQTSMAAARPILAHAAGDVARLVTDCCAGLAATPGDVTSVVAAVRQLCNLPPGQLQSMGRNGRVEYERTFSPAAGVNRLESMLDQSKLAVGHA